MRQTHFKYTFNVKFFIYAHKGQMLLNSTIMRRLLQCANVERVPLPVVDVVATLVAVAESISKVNQSELCIRSKCCLCKWMKYSSIRFA